jgi:signal transduction histidine kinase
LEEQSFSSPAFCWPFWFNSNLKRVAKVNAIKSQNEAEKAEIAITQARRERHLNDFIAHEVRNPLLSSAIAALCFLSETAKEQVEDQNTRIALMDDIDILDNSLNYINDLLRNMLDIHRTKNKEFKLKCEPTDVLTELLEPAKAILRVRGAKAKIVIQAECEPNLIVNIDRLRAQQQILLNLAQNACKFVEEGFIRLYGQPWLMGKWSFTSKTPGLGYLQRSEGGCLRSIKKALISFTKAQASGFTSART